MIFRQTIKSMMAKATRHLVHAHVGTNKERAKCGMGPAPEWADRGAICHDGFVYDFSLDTPPYLRIRTDLDKDGDWGVFADDPDKIENEYTNEDAHWSVRR